MVLGDDRGRIKKVKDEMQRYKGRNLRTRKR